MKELSRLVFRLGLVVGLGLPSLLVAQNPYKGDRLYRAKNTMSGNLVRTVYYNYGLVGNIGEISGEWPAGTGNEYVGDVSPLIGVEIVHPSGDTLVAVATSDGPRGNPDGPQGGGAFWGLEPLPGFTAPPEAGRDLLVAISDDTTTWPDFWPDRNFNDVRDLNWARDENDPGWTGSWNGYFGKNQFNADQETYFQMDDQADEEWFERILYNNADTVAFWAPEEPVRGDDVVITYDALEGTLPDDIGTVYLQWGVDEVVHDQWTPPPSNLWPSGSTPIDSAIRSPMLPRGNGRFEITLATGSAISSLHLKFSDGADLLDNNYHSNWNIFLDGGQRSYYYYPSREDSTRRGLGLRVTVRGLQWSHFLAQDCIFWLYEITNVSSYTYDKVAFGMMVGTLSGGRQDSRDDLAQFILSSDITYSYDGDDQGSPGWVPVRPGERNVGYVGYAFLESPGNPVDGIDNDGDDTLAGAFAPVFTAGTLEAMAQPVSFQPGDPLVLIDYETYERRVDSFPQEGPLTYRVRDRDFRLDPGQSVMENGTNGIDDNFNGLIDERDDSTLVGLRYIDYFTGAGANDPMIDEARDDGIDNDGDWNSRKDDVGADGAPGTRDFGEGDGIPTSGEPNFDRTDVDESDQIGLTAFEYFTPPGNVRMRDDPALWLRMQPGRVDTVNPTPEDGDFIYGSGYFPLQSGQTERFSMALVYGADLQDIENNERIVQQIYDENYNFARPPDPPTVWAVPGDGKVTLYWDGARSESSIDPVSDTTDFEGYKIYRSTDPRFLEIFTITDYLGNPVFFRPTAQFDLVNDWEDFFPQQINGITFYLGSNSGIVHSWTDNTVENGQTYYYAVCAYDRGDTERGIFPAENDKTINVDEGGNVTLDINTAVVTPRAPASGFETAQVGGIRHLSGQATGAITAEVLDPLKIPENTDYRFSFLYQPDTAFVDTMPGDSIPPDTLIREIFGYRVTRLQEGIGETPVVAFDSIVTRVNLLPIADRLSAYYDSLFNLEDNSYHPRLHFDVAESKIYDGQRAYMLVPREVTVLDELTTWADTSAGLDSVNVVVFTDPNIYPYEYRVPANYDIEWFDGVVDTSSYYLFPNTDPPLELPPVPVNFRVRNVTYDYYTDFLFLDRSSGRPGLVDPEDQIIFFEPFPGSDDTTRILSWRVRFVYSLSGGDTVPPRPGDVLHVAIYQSFGGNDLYEYSSQAATVDPGKVVLDKIRVYPNPYVAVSPQEPANPFAEGRGERRITFTHLPSTCKIRIYTVRGELVQTLNHAAAIDDGLEHWDLRSKDGLNVAYGVYLYHVDSDFGEAMGRFAVIK